jgi:flagellin-like hook-associated protein FlgL
MRITQSMMANNVLNNLSNDLQSMQTAENQFSCPPRTAP